MLIRNIKVAHFRNIQELILTFDHRFNFFFGENGSGKTSILESLYFLVSGKSFRSSIFRQFIQYHQNQVSVLATLGQTVGRDIRVGIAKHVNSGVQIQINGNPERSLIPLAKILPMQVIAPDRFSLVDDESEFRRRFVDWGVFHVEPTFSDLSKQLRYVVKQRNALLKVSGDIAQFQPWDMLLIEISNKVHQLRSIYINELEQSFRNLVDDCDQAYQLNFYQGWPTHCSLEQCISESFYQDKRLCYSQYGAHRADLILLYNGRSAKNHLSRGQRKLLNIYLVLAQVHHLYHLHGKRTVCLIDDLSSELDVCNRRRVYKMLEVAQSQAFITGITVDPVLLEKNYPIKVFHVEQGGCREQSTKLYEVVEELT